MVDDIGMIKGSDEHRVELAILPAEGLQLPTGATFSIL